MNVKNFFLIGFLCLVVSQSLWSQQGLSRDWEGEYGLFKTKVCNTGIEARVTTPSFFEIKNFFRSILGEGKNIDLLTSNYLMRPQQKANTLLINIPDFLGNGEAGNSKSIITFTFEKPVKNPILQLVNITGGFKGVLNDSIYKRSLSMELITPDLELKKLSGSSEISVNNNQILAPVKNNIVPFTVGDPASDKIEGFSGSVMVEGLVTTVSFRMDLFVEDRALANVYGQPRDGRLFLRYGNCTLLWEVGCSDFDGDGIDDEYDLDDDNDGILDVVEIVENLFLDTDKDLLIDSVDIDSDGDGCFDVVEAGFTDPDGDGILGISPVEVDEQGRVLNFGGYVEPLKESSIYSFQKEGIPIEILKEPKFLLRTCKGETEILIVETNISQQAFYLWQVFKNNEWVDLEESSTYEGVHSESLKIDTTNILENELYRVLCWSENYRCPTVTEGTRLVIDQMFFERKFFQDLTLCFNEIDTFSFEEKSQEILENRAREKFKITYHNSFESVKEGINALSNLRGMDHNSRIFVRIENLELGCVNFENYFDVFVVESPKISIPDTISLCLFDEKGLEVFANNSSTDTYLWSTGEITQSIRILNLGSYHVTVTSENGCTISKIFDIVPEESVGVDVTFFLRPNEVTAIASGEEVYKYELDKGSSNAILQESNIFYDVPSGLHTMSIYRKEGCNYFDIPFYVLNHPQFFSPNGDGINDTWHIHDLNIILENKTAEIKIYNRHGVLLHEMNEDLSKPWDGTDASGKLLNSDDYWFYVDVYFGKGHIVYQGHFSLLR